MSRLRLKVNDNFFSTPNLLNSYWAGFIAADGCIYAHKSNKINTLDIHLAEKDYWQLRNLAEDLDFEGSVKKKKQDSYSLRIRSEKICVDLKKNFNIIPRKTLKLQPPLKLTKNQKLAYIKGYIDGDGSIFFSKNYTTNGPFIIFNVLGTKKMVTWIKNTLQKKYKFLMQNNIYKTGKIYTFKVSGKRAKNFLVSLDNIKTPRLDRKWDRIYA